MEFSELGDPKYIALETFRKSGEGVITPVWVALENGKLYVWTGSDSGKVKRIRNNGRIRLAVSDMRGNPKSEWVEGRARTLDTPEEEAGQRDRLAAKYGFQYKLWNMMARMRGGVSDHTVLELSPPDAQDNGFGG